MSERVVAKWKKTTIEEIVSSDSLYVDGDWVESKDQDPNGKNRLIQLADIGDGSFLNKSKRFLNDEQFSRLNCTQLEEGDLLIARMPDPIGRACVFPKQTQRCATVVDVAILRTNNANRYWLMSVINSENFRREISKNSTGTTRTRIARSELSKIKLQAPPPPEQKKIASILTSVDEVIENTQKQIDKLQDLKKATMNELLTKGIGHTEFKDSKLGRIPKSWDVVSISDLALIDRESLSSSTSPDYQFFYIDITSVKTCFINIPPTKIKYADSPSRARRVVRKGDVLLSTVRPNLKAFAYVENDCLDWVCSTGFSVLSPKNDNDGRFIFYSVLSKFITKQIETLVVGSNYPAINSTDVKSLLVLRPSLSEQKKIASTLNSIDICIKDKQQKLHQTQSLKKALMQDLLTGKVRVQVN